MKQFTIWENPTDRPANWSSFHNADLPKLYETEFQGITPFELPSFPPDTPAVVEVTQGGLDVSSAGKVIAATVMGVMPTIGGTSLDDGTPPSLTIPSSGTRYIVVTVTGTFALKGSTFVMPTYASAPTVTITVETSNPGYAGTHSVSTGTFKFLLATFVDGIKTGQNGHGPITAEICDSLNQDAKANLNLTWAAA